MMNRAFPACAAAASIAAALLVPGIVRAQLVQLRHWTGQGVSPVFEGFDVNPDGSFNMWFGYMNRNYEEEVDIPIGADNRFEPGGDRGQPIWSPDGKQVAYVSTREQYSGIYRKAWDGTGEEELLFRYTPGAGIGFSDWSSDGRFLTFSTGVLLIVPLRENEKALDRKALEWMREEYDVFGGRFSPDMRFLAYASDELNSQSTDVYVRPFDASKPDTPGPGPIVRVTKTAPAVLPGASRTARRSIW